jgi:hypothetical protein
MLWALPIPPHLTLITALRGRYFYPFHSLDEETQAKRDNMSKVMLTPGWHVNSGLIPKTSCLTMTLYWSNRYRSVGSLCSIFQDPHPQGFNTNTSIRTVRAQERSHFFGWEKQPCVLMDPCLFLTARPNVLHTMDYIWLSVNSQGSQS